MKILEAFTNFDIVRCPEAYDEIFDRYGGGEDETEFLVDMYSVHAVMENGDIWTHERAFMYVRGNDEKELAEKLAARVNEALEINPDRWYYNEYLSASLEDRLRMEYELEQAA